MGHLILAHGVKPGLEKAEARRNMPALENEDDVRRFLGSVRYLAKFLPHLPEVEEPLHQKDTAFNIKRDIAILNRASNFENAKILHNLAY